MRRLLLLSLLAVAAAPEPSPFRFQRPVEAAPGWCVLELPEDVLDACRPGLPDLRLMDSRDGEVPYAFAQEEGAAAPRRELTNVESVSRRETLALLDRGASPPLARSAELEISGEEFLKPVALEASDDGRAFREVARATLFAHAGLRSTTLRFPGNDRRYWRFRFDDRNGDAIRPLAVRVEGTGAPVPLREIPLSVALSAGDHCSVAAVRLPGANLGVAAVRLLAEEPAYERRVRIFERVFFRDEVSRRLVGAATISRSPGGLARSEVPVCDPASRNLEIEIDNGDSPPLHISSAAALARPRRLLFFAPARGSGSLSLLYGSPAVVAPRYDLAAALRQGPPRSPAAASLGPAADSGALAPVALPPRGAPLDAAAWRSRQMIETPISGTVAYLDLRPPLTSRLSSVRVLDGENRQVPYVVEQSSRHSIEAVIPAVSQEKNRTIAKISGLDPARAPDALTLFAASPDYFSRDVVVLEEERDARGVTGDRVLGSAHWERRSGEPARSLMIRIAPPQGTTVRAEIENGDNAALTIGRAEISTPFTRIDFVFLPGEKLWLISDNPETSAPHYDFAMVADHVLDSSGSPAGLRPDEKPQDKPGLPKWFWLAVAAAAVLVTGALVRTLRSVSA